MTSLSARLQCQNKFRPEIVAIKRDVFTKDVAVPPRDLNVTHKIITAPFALGANLVREKAVRKARGAHDKARLHPIKTPTTKPQSEIILIVECIEVDACAINAVQAPPPAERQHVTRRKTHAAESSLTVKRRTIWIGHAKARHARKLVNRIGKPIERRCQHIALDGC